MLELAVLEWATGIVVGAAAAYHFSRNDDGCNGHHWGEPKRANKSSMHACREAGLPSGDYYSVDMTLGTVELHTKVIKECEDCGKQEVDTMRIGAMPVSAFEEHSVV